MASKDSDSISQDLGIASQELGIPFYTYKGLASDAFTNGESACRRAATQNKPLSLDLPFSQTNDCGTLSMKAGQPVNNELDDMETDGEQLPGPVGFEL